MDSIINLRSGAWYGDYLVHLKMPSNWDVTLLWPLTPPPLTEEQISQALRQPVGQPSIQVLCKGKNRPLIIVDDLNRPTPPEPVINVLLNYFEDAGISPKNVTILMATGTHGKPAVDAVNKKVGKKAAQNCRLLIHDCFKNTVKIGATSFGTPIYVNKAILESDYVTGIGGIYPNYTVGFGGGSKIALGVLGLQSIFDLHFRHQSVGWGYSGVDTSLRRDLNEIANMIGLRTIISVQINADRQIIRIDSGDPQKYYPEALNFCKNTFNVKRFDNADVVISNSYPNDLSLTFARAKGFMPLTSCGPNVSRVAIASCDDGIGLHNIFPFLNTPRFHKEQQLFRMIKAYGIGGFSVRAAKYACHKIFNGSKANVSKKNVVHKYPILFFRPGAHKIELPSKIPGILQKFEWSDVLEAIKEEQGEHRVLKVIVYPCASLQFELEQVPMQVTT